MIDTRRNTQRQAPKDEYVLSLKGLIGVVWKRLWLVALAAIVLGGAAVGASLLQTPQYQASARILVGQGQSFTDSPNNTLGFQQLTQTMATAAESQRIYEPIIERFDLGVSSEEFEGSFSAQQVSATQFIEITYEDSDPETASRVASALAEEFSEQIAESGEGESPITATVWTEADTPTEPVSPEPARDGILALLVGGMLGVGVAFLLEFFDDSWGSPEEAEQISGAPVFGVIPEFDPSAASRKSFRKDRERGKQPDEALAASMLEKIGPRELGRIGGAVWPMGVAVLDPDGRLKESNSTIQEMFGLSEEELRGKTIQSLASHPDDVEENAKLQAEVARGEREHYQIEKRLLRKDRQLAWVRLTVSKTQEEGDDKLLVGMIEDVSHEKQIEEKLRLATESERLYGERLRRIADRSSLVVHYFTPDGYLLGDNGGWDRLWDTGAEESNGSNVFENEYMREVGLTPYIEKSVSDKEAVVTPTLAMNRHAKNGGAAANGSNGGARWIQASIEPLTDEENRVVEVVMVIEDVTSRERADRERRAVESDLRESLAARERLEKELRETQGRFKSLMDFVTGAPDDRKED